MTTERETVSPSTGIVWPTLSAPLVRPAIQQQAPPNKNHTIRVVNPLIFLFIFWRRGRGVFSGFSLTPPPPETGAGDLERSHTQAMSNKDTQTQTLHT